MNRLARYIRDGGSTARTLGTARPYRATDSLDGLPYHRAHYIAQRRAGHALDMTEYGWLLGRVMRPTLGQLRMIEAAIRCDVAARDALAAWRAVA